MTAKGGALAAVHDWDARAVSISKFLQIAGPVSSPWVLKTLKSAHSDASTERLLAVSQLREALEHLKRGKDTQVYVNLVAFLLERGIMKGIAAGLKDCAKGNWITAAPLKEVVLGMTTDAHVIVNNVETYAGCLVSMAVDVRCAAFISREFSALVKVAKAIFIGSPAVSAHAESVDYDRLSKEVKDSIVNLLMSAAVMSRSIMKKVAEDTSFIENLLKHAMSIEDADQEIPPQFGAAVMLIYDVVLSNADVSALRSSLLRLVEKVLAVSWNKQLLESATRILAYTVFIGCQEQASPEWFAGFSLLGSSLLVLFSLGDLIPEEMQRAASDVGHFVCWKQLEPLQGKVDLKSGFKILFQLNPTAQRRAVEFRTIFSGSSREAAVFSLPKAKGKQWLGMETTGNAALPRLQCRKCSQSSCPNVEGTAGTFQVCGGCKVAVYCSKDCQKRAWKEGHREMCRPSRSSATTSEVGEPASPGSGHDGHK